LNTSQLLLLLLLDMVFVFKLITMLAYAQNPLDTFSRNFPVDGEVANVLRTSTGKLVKWILAFMRLFLRRSWASYYFSVAGLITT